MTFTYTSFTERERERGGGAVCVVKKDRICSDQIRTSETEREMVEGIIFRDRRMKTERERV